MQDNSSSFHFVSGDRKLDPISKILYVLSFFAESWQNRNRRLPFEVISYRPVFNREKLVTAFGEQILNRSPSRILCADFQVETLPRLVKPAPSVLDLGCGRGEYSQHLRNIIGYKRYLGIDLNWSPDFSGYERDDTRFTQANLGVEEIDVSHFDLVFSQSVLEHIRYDRRLFSLLKARERTPRLHVHFVPATRSFYEYRFHGYRRYGPLEIARLLSTREIDNIQVYMLGNQLTRRLFRKRYFKGIKRLWTVGDTTPYDPTLTMFDNLVNVRDRLQAESVHDASMFCLVFRHAPEQL